MTDVEQRMELVQEALYLAKDIGLGFEMAHWKALVLDTVEDSKALVDKLLLLKAEIAMRLLNAKNGDTSNLCGLDSIYLPNLKDFGL